MMEINLNKLTAKDLASITGAPESALQKKSFKDYPNVNHNMDDDCLLYTSPSPRDS